MNNKNLNCQLAYTKFIPKNRCIEEKKKSESTCSSSGKEEKEIF